MNRFQLTIIFSTLCFATFTSCSDNKKKLKDKVTKECIEGGEQQFTDPKIKEYFLDYCKCSGEKTSENLSSTEWKEFEELKKAGREAEMQAKLQPVIQPCLDELQKKIVAASPESVPAN